MRSLLFPLDLELPLALRDAEGLPLARGWYVYLARQSLG